MLNKKNILFYFTSLFLTLSLISCETSKTRRPQNANRPSDVLSERITKKLRYCRHENTSPTTTWYTKINGPNCHNTSLINAGILDSVRHTTTEEMKFWLASPLCKRITPNQEIPENYIRLIKTRRKFASKELIVHSQFIVNGDFVIEKLGATEKDPYKFAEREDVGRSTENGGYDWKTIVRHPQCAHATAKPEKCWVWAEFYDCTSFNDFIESQENHLGETSKKSLEDTLNLIEEYELLGEVISCNFSNGKDVRRQIKEFRALKSKISSIISLEFSEKKSPFLNKFKQYLETRIESFDLHVNSLHAGSFKTNTSRGLIY